MRSEIFHWPQAIVSGNKNLIADVVKADSVVIFILNNVRIESSIGSATEICQQDQCHRRRNAVFGVFLVKSETG